MKIRNILTVLTVLMMFGLVFTLTACSSGSSLSGKYAIINVLDDPETTFKEMKQKYKAEKEKITNYFYFEFQKDGKFTLVIAGEEEAIGVYLVDGKTLTLTSGGESVRATFKGGKITYDYETGAQLIFKKLGLSTGAIIGVVVGSMVLLGAGGCAIYWFIIRKKKVA